MGCGKSDSRPRRSSICSWFGSLGSTLAGGVVGDAAPPGLGWAGLGGVAAVPTGLWAAGLPLGPLTADAAGDGTGLGGGSGGTFAQELLHDGHNDLVAQRLVLIGIDLAVAEASLQAVDKGCAIDPGADITWRTKRRNGAWPRLR